MVALLTLVAVILGFSHWLVEPLIRLLTPLLTLGWLGWAALLLLAWLLAGSSGQGAGEATAAKLRQPTISTPPRGRSG